MSLQKPPTNQPEPGVHDPGISPESPSASCGERVSPITHDTAPKKNPLFAPTRPIAPNLIQPPHVTYAPPAPLMATQSGAFIPPHATLPALNAPGASALRVSPTLPIITPQAGGRAATPALCGSFPHPHIHGTLAAPGAR
jgi:hypothetical protein